MAHIWPKLLNCVKRGFLWKMTNTTFFNLSCPIMPKCLKKKICDRSWDIRLDNFGPNWAQILLLLEKGIFWENWLTLLFSTHYATLSQKNTGRSCDIRCWSFGPNWTQITHLSLNGIFFKKLTDIFVYFRYPITILQCLKKNH